LIAHSSLVEGETKPFRISVTFFRSVSSILLKRFSIRQKSNSFGYALRRRRSGGGDHEDEQSENEIGKLPSFGRDQILHQRDEKEDFLYQFPYWQDRWLCLFGVQTNGRGARYWSDTKTGDADPHDCSKKRRRTGGGSQSVCRGETPARSERCREDRFSGANAVHQRTMMAP